MTNENGADGLKIDCDGAITLNGITANGNEDFGTWVSNSSESISSGVTILATLGANNFNDNDAGLLIGTRGVVSLTSVTANKNINGNGIEIDNRNCSGSGCPTPNVMFNKVAANSNSGNGMRIVTNAAVVNLTGLISMSNGYSGIEINSWNPVAKISLLNGMFMANQLNGVEIHRITSPTPVYPVVLSGTIYFGNNPMKLIDPDTTLPYTNLKIVNDL